jgi:DNA-binding CsgD family transcriptional regulator
VTAVNVAAMSPHAVIGRRAECGELDRLLQAVRSGESRSLIVHGPVGAGKTALLDYLAGQASGCRVARVAAAQSEVNLAFAGLHQLCGPMLEMLDRLPQPQREAARTAFAISAGPAPDLFLVGLAMLRLLSEVARERPLVCLIDDAQWLDRTSLLVLAFVARRLRAESVALVFGSRSLSAPLECLPNLVVEALRDAGARALLDSVMTGPIDAQVRDQIIAETRGNPLALLKLPRGLTPADLAGGFRLPGAMPLPGAVKESFRRRVSALPAQTGRLLLLAAADPTGNAALVWRAARHLGIGIDAAQPATEAGLAEFGTRVRFQHPLIRSAVYQAESAGERCRVHRALAEATDPRLDPDRRAWHRAQALAGPDEDVAAELERSAERAQARGGPAAAAAFLERSVALTLDPARRAQRALAAAQAKVHAGALDGALEMLTASQAEPLDDIGGARAELLRAQVVHAQNRGSNAPSLLLRAAQRLEPLDVRLARATYLDALAAAFAGSPAEGAGIAEVAQAALASPRPLGQPRPLDLLLQGTATQCTAGYAAGAPMLKQALSALRTDEFSAAERLECGSLTYRSSMDLWDDEHWYALSDRNVKAARETGALTALQFALSSRICAQAFMGELAAGSTLSAELLAVCHATHSHLPPYSSLALAAWQGREADVTGLAESAINDAREHGERQALSAAQWALAVLYNGLGRYEEALSAALRADDYQGPGFAGWSLAELIEAAVRCGQSADAAAALEQLEARARHCGSAWALGVAARSRALVSHGRAAETAYQEAIEQLRRTRVRTEHARAHLAYGEWLRRERRRADARQQLRLATHMLEEAGMEAFADLAHRELRAAGEAHGKRVATRLGLTAQESQVARLARDGLSNPEIGTRLCISARTVQFHLRNVFSKLGISSRSQLYRVLPDTAA